MEDSIASKIIIAAVSPKIMVMREERAKQVGRRIRDIHRNWMDIQSITSETNNWRHRRPGRTLTPLGKTTIRAPFEVAIGLCTNTTNSLSHRHCTSCGDCVVSLVIASTFLLCGTIADGMARGARKVSSRKKAVQSGRARGGRRQWIATHLT